MNKNQDDDDEVDNTCNDQSHKELGILKAQRVPTKSLLVVLISNPFLKFLLEHYPLNHYIQTLSKGNDTSVGL